MSRIGKSHLLGPGAALGALGVLSGAAAGPEASPAGSAAFPPGYSTARTGSVHDFDYFAGAWTTRQHRLRARGVDSHDWEDFPGTLCMRLYLDGLATVAAGSRSDAPDARRR